jgi:hypothetical protein
MKTPEQNPPRPRPEPYVTLQAAAEAFHLPKFKVQRAARLGLIPTYTFYNKRKLVRISEVAAAFKAVEHD